MLIDSKIPLDLLLDKIQGSTSGKDLKALAFTGSRAAGFHTDKSDYDFLAVISSESDFKRQYLYSNFNFNDCDISILIEPQPIFENNLIKNNHCTEHGRLVYFQYQPLVGEDYLKQSEHLSRTTVVKRFLFSLPNKSVKFSLNNVIDWTILEASMYYPHFCNRIERILPKKEIIYSLGSKYASVLEELNVAMINQDDICKNYIYTNNKAAEDKDLVRMYRTSFLKELHNSICLYFRKNDTLTVKKLLLGGAYQASQIPEIIYNSMKVFPIFEDEGNHLVYRGPSMEEFLDARSMFRGLREYTDFFKSKLFENS
jgi:hypothetical protein